ncbi:MAG: UDP-N-acetylglucosamine--N-acetylmuramyl-(pentapeptide) pyrophosphoryl-undecaprenol N-acetylglucosamine transferase [Clostridiaceae bacterium]|jgi:UDP-N-acetylglucosamine--N-acetylmuramyl-(pentapeptide) pyrophosphoryl-undecaprenol N-acetylglucosamine transferase|nr:UDP-N-acetylglucosamine--N-acetylmuramyl-(pentapeptide) pyrophosphoryl-undecaprenol N-acetylglucosamine transferase [Clostridiaceae bacterium]
MSELILLTGGGTGGHVFPNIALLPELKPRFREVCYMGGSGMEKEIAARYGLRFFEVNSPKFKRELTFDNFKIPIELLHSVKSARQILAELKPSVIFSKGGYVSLPAVLAAHHLDIPVVCHESDFSLGVANRIAKLSGARLLTAFPIGVGEIVGMPLRTELSNGNRGRAFDALSISGQDTRPYLLIIGGSSGATALNKAVYSCLDILLETYNIIHIAGKNGDFSVTRDRYRQIEFSNDMQDLYAAADCVVSRAGATAVAELSYLKKRALFIPLPKSASRGDQIKNAQYAEQHGAALLFQEDLTPQSFIDACMRLKNLSPMRECVKVANTVVADICASEAN